MEVRGNLEEGGGRLEDQMELGYEGEVQDRGVVGGMNPTANSPVVAEFDEELREEEADAYREEEEGDWDQVGPDSSLEDVFEGLNLDGEEEEDLVLSGKVEELIKEVRWLCLFRVHTLRPFSHAALLNSMRNAWTCAQGVTFNIKGRIFS